MAINNIPLAAEQEANPQQPPIAAAPPAHPHVLHQHSISNASTATVDVEAWTAEALASLAISPAARGTGAALTIPLDDHDHASSTTAPRMKLRNVAFDGAGAGIVPPRRPPSRRDSMKKRDELLKGKEGSRQRRRWENDHLLHVPNAQPPLPTDWQVRPTHPVLPTVPYALAQYWDKGLRERVEERKAAFAAHQRKKTNYGVAATVMAEVGKVPRDLRAKAKKTPAVRSWLRVLEEPVRQFLVDAGLVAKAADESAIEDSSDTEDEEIVFVGRNGSMVDGKTFKRAQRVEKGKPAESGMVLDTTGDDESGAFKRFLTHSISEYYGLSSKSITTGNPARRVVYIGVKQMGQRHAPLIHVLPPPLWEMFDK
ncbi:R3H-associated N-terminal domain-containing protein [Cercophora newfieldiana]|uniref:R3H-associated N-terminal domain-containing protein n=1 Tax=Cercophora newfieldiana TaxID=92897 RepID=A0AA39XWW7_9PEZI|nr:R3H-associated N-terminal domain-containing protein [Cercophora newfieldiana]